jgi:glutaredoxin
VIAVAIYTRPGCHLCGEMKTLLDRVVRQMNGPVAVEEIDIEDDVDLEARYGQEIPVLLINGRKAAKFRVTEEDLTRMLMRARAAESQSTARNDRAG